MIKTFLFRLGHLGFLIGLSAASIVYSFNILSGHSKELMGPAFAFLTMFIVYNFDHLRDSQKTDKCSTPERSLFMHKYERLFRILIGICALCFFLLAWTYQPFFLCTGAFYVLSVIFYVVPLIPGSRIKRLKDIPLFKNFYVPACWLILIMYSEVDLWHINAGVGMAAGYFFVRLFISGTTGDVRDLKADEMANITTIATSAGRENTLLILQLLNMASMGMIISACINNIWPVYSLIMILPIIYIVILLKVLYANPNQGEFISEIYDFELISYGPILLISNLFH